MEKLLDFLGNEIKVGDRAIRISSIGHWKEFVKVTVKQIDPLRGKDCIGIVPDGHQRIGWTYPERLLIQSSLTVKI